MNPGDKSRREINIDLVRQVNDFFKGLSPLFVIFHAGVDGQLDETIKQLHDWQKHFSEMHQKTVIENQPQAGLNDEKGIGASVEEMSQVLNSTGLRSG